MQTIKKTIETKIVFDDSGKHRYLLEKIWDSSKETATVLMLFPSGTEAIQSDLTTMLVTNNADKLGYGGVRIVNLFSRISARLGANEDELNKSENDEIIVQAVKDSDCTILAQGRVNTAHFV